MKSQPSENVRKNYSAIQLTFSTCNSHSNTKPLHHWIQWILFNILMHFTSSNEAWLLGKSTIWKSKINQIKKNIIIDICIYAGFHIVWHKRHFFVDFRFFSIICHLRISEAAFERHDAIIRKVSSLDIDMMPLHANSGLIACIIQIHKINQFSAAFPSHAVGCRVHWPHHWSLALTCSACQSVS